jgi:hypothetical protein
MCQNQHNGCKAHPKQRPSGLVKYVTKHGGGEDSHKIGNCEKVTRF